MRRRRINPAQLTGVSEQSATVGELPEDYEQQGKEIFGALRRRRAKGEYSNPYTQVNIPFVTDGTSQRVLPANPRRTYLIVQNKGADFIYVNFSQAATTDNGLRIIAGGNYEIIGGEDGGSHVPRDDVFVLGAVAGLNCVVSEGMIQD